MSRFSNGRPWRCIVPAIVLSALSCAGTERGVESPPKQVDAAEILMRKAEILRAVDRGSVDEALLAAVDHESAAVRAAAVQALGFIGDASARPRVEAALDAEEPLVRREAAFSLGLLGDPAGLPALSESVGDENVIVRLAVATALGMLDDPAAAQPLLTLLDDPYANVAAAACAAVSRQSEASFAVESLIGLTKGDERSATVAAARALAGLASTSDRLDFPSRRAARRRLIELADSGIVEVRIAAARGLRIPSGVGEADALLQLGKDGDPRVRIGAIHAFSFPGSPISQFMLEALGDEDERIALAAVQGLGRMRGPEIPEALLNVMIYDERVWLKAAAVPELRRVDADRAAAFANGLTRYEYPSVRLAVTRLLVGRNDAESVEYATRLFNDADPQVRRAAIPAMAGAPARLAAVLADVIDSTDPLVRARLAEAASWRLRDDSRTAEERQEAFELLHSLWERADEDTDPTVRIAVLDAARPVGAAPEARALLEAGLAATDRRVRERAAFHLASRHGETRESAAPELPIEHYIEILEWAARPWAAIVTVERPGFIPARFTIQLNNTTPLTSWAFAQLAAGGHFDGQRVERLLPTLSVRFGRPEPARYPDAELTIRREPILHSLGVGTVWTNAKMPGSAAPDFRIAFAGQPHRVGELTPFGQVVQNLDGVVFRLLPGDIVVKVEIYEGTGGEPLPPL